MQPPAAAISKRAILSVRMAPFGSPKKRKGRCPLTPELPYLTHISEIICGRLSSERFGVLLFPLGRCCAGGTKRKPIKSQG